jgi:hypothetical protein
MQGSHRLPHGVRASASANLPRQDDVAYATSGSPRSVTVLLAHGWLIAGTHEELVASRCPYAELYGIKAAAYR